MENMYDRHLVIVHWKIKQLDEQRVKHVCSFHICEGERIANNFRELLATLNVEGLQEYAKSCEVPVQDNDQVSIVTTDCVALRNIDCLRDIDISEIRNKYIVHKEDK